MNAKQLKNALLQHAIQGRLVPQDPDDEPADVLLQRIRAEKEQLIKEGKIKKQKPLPPITEEEKPFTIPDSWQWVRLGELAARINYGFTASASMHGDIKFLRITDINIKTNVVNWDSVPFCTIDKNKINSYLLLPNDILIARTGGTIGKFYIVDKKIPKSIFASYLIRISLIKNITTRYIGIFLSSPAYWSQIIDSSMGTGQPNVNSIALASLKLPFPPLAEQQRIVARLEELLPDVEAYGTAQERLTTLESSFPQQLRKSLLQEAIQGRLVPQNPDDEPADVLLQRIRAEKEQLIKEGKIKKQKPLPPITEGEIPFSIPENWKWTYLEEFSIIIPTKNHQILQSEIQKSGSIPVVSQSYKYIDGYSNDKSKIFKNIDSIIIFGDHTRCVKYIDFNFIVGADGVKIISPIICNNKYIYYMIKFFCYSLRNRGYSRHFQFLKNTPFPLPPLAEQQRIVARLEELLPLCDGLMPAGGQA